MLGQPIYILPPRVVGFKLFGKLREGVTATDLVLTVTQMLRKKNVVDQFVEFYGPGVSAMSLPDRATIGNMAPDYGATIGFFPIDVETVSYLRRTNRGAAADMVESMLKRMACSAPTMHRNLSYGYTRTRPGERCTVAGRAKAAARSRLAR